MGLLLRLLLLTSVLPATIMVLVKVAASQACGDTLLPSGILFSRFFSLRILQTVLRYAAQDECTSFCLLLSLVFK